MSSLQAALDVFDTGPHVLPLASVLANKIFYKGAGTTVDSNGFSGLNQVPEKSAAALGKVAPAVQSIAAAQGVPASAADVRSVPTSLGAAFQIPSGSIGDSAMSQIQSILGQISANSAKATAQSQAFAREQMAFQQAANAKAMEFNAEQARINREWQEYMSNTAHQREVEDLKAAGLNPILSAMGGNGAPVGSGATASGMTSAGAKGEVYDANAAMSGVLSTMLAGLMNLEAVTVSARASEAVADKYTAMSKLVEEMREGFEANYPSNMWRALISAINDISGAGNGWYSKWVYSRPVYDFR